MSNKRLRPNIVRGGIAIPIPNKKNYYYMKGRKHEQGGIDIGKNPRTGLEVEDGEVMHISPTEVKVFSSVPFLILNLINYTRKHIKINVELITAIIYAFSCLCSLPISFERVYRSIGYY